MNQYQELYKKKQMSAEQALELIQDGDSMFSAQAAAEPQAILSKLQHLKETGVKGTTLNSCLPIQYYDAMKDPEMAGIMSHNGWFFTAGLRDAQKKKLVSAVPQSSTSVLRKSLQRLQAEGRRPVVLATVSPMDSHGYFSLSVSAIYERDLIDQGALVLLEVNPNFPRTFGDTQVHISEVDALVESDRPIPTKSLVPYTEVDKKIGAFVASLVEDGSTIQLGIGNIPNAVANELRSKRHLGIHTEMFTETMVDLIECGAVDNSQKGFMNGFSVCSFTMGSQRLYDFVHNNPSVLFKSSTFSNDPYTIARNNKFVSVNASLEIDLTGRDLLIVEDILDSGKTLHYLVDLLKSREPNSIEICTLFDKPERREVDVHAKYIGCAIPDAFIVGYGLDYDEKYRNLPFVGVLKPEVYGA